jgi:UDP-glucose 4-epimerase
MRIVVTGGSGLVGSRIVRELAHGHDVVNLDLREPAERVGDFVRGDILDEGALRRVFQGADAIVHTAALPGPSFGTEEELERVNADGTGIVAAAAAALGIRRVVHISSEAILGFVFSEGRTRPLYLPIDEKHPISPTESYGRSKLRAEVALARNTSDEATAVVLRPPWVWVPEEYEKDRRLTGSPDEWWHGLWAYVHGDDVARAAALAVTADLPPGIHAAYVAAPDSGTDVPTGELLDRYYPDVPIHGDLPEFGSLISSAAAAELLGFAPAMTWREFLA